jgi:hypothetical protein
MKKYNILAVLLICFCTTGLVWYLYNKSKIRDMTIGKDSKCSIHSIEMVKLKVPILYGLIEISESDEIEAEKNTFTNGRVLIEGGLIKQKETEALVYICPKCATLYAQWWICNKEKLKYRYK